MSIKRKIAILVLVAYYLPGYKSGGPVRTISNLVQHLGDEFVFYIITKDRDFGDNNPYKGIETDIWQRVGKANIFYMSEKNKSLSRMAELINSINYDILYLNSFFSKNFSIKLLLLKKINLIANKPTIVAPRGEFSAGALGLKRIKKMIYIFTSKVTGLYKDVIFQASSEFEKKDILEFFNQARIIEAPNLSILANSNNENQKRIKNQEELNIIFLSRISRKKNLEYALKVLFELKGRITFSVYGPIEDDKYWTKCQKIINKLPDNIKVQYKGILSNDKVINEMKTYHLLFLPTLGENFGHVILEAFLSGLPVLISDQTPWRELEEKGVGWDLPLDRVELFRNILQKCVDMDEENYNTLSSNALLFGKEVIKNKDNLKKNKDLFITAFNAK